MKCKNSCERHQLINEMWKSILPETWHLYNSLSIELRFYILMGLYCPFQESELMSIIINDCYHIHNMNKRRMTCF